MNTRPRTSLLAASLGVALVLAGCSAAPSAPSRSSTPSPAVSAAVDDRDLAVPASLLPGDCARLVPDPSGVAGTTLTPQTVGSDGAQQRQAGDLNCRWAASADLHSVGLSLEVRRHGAVLAADPLGWWSATGTGAGIGAERSAIDCQDISGAGGTCTIDARVGDYWFGLDLSTPDGVSATARRAGVVAAARTLTDFLSSSPVPAEWTPPRGSWPAVVDCAALGAKADVAGAVADPALVVADTTRYGDEFEMSEQVARLGGASTCTWSDPRDASATFSQISAKMLAGSGWSLKSAPEGAETIDIPGADVATIACSSTSERCAVVVRIGVNVVTIADPAVSPLADIAPTRAQVVATATTVVAALRALYP